MRNTIIFCLFALFTSVAIAQSDDDVSESLESSEQSIIPSTRVFEGAMIQLVSEPTEFSDGSIKVLDLNKYSDPNCRTCWITLPLSKSYSLKIARIKSKAKLSDVINHDQSIVAVFVTKSNKVARISYDRALLTEEFYSSLEN